MNYRSQWPLPGLAIALFLTLASQTAGEESTHPAMKDPSKATETAPSTFTAKFETTKGDIEIECTREWAPHGVDRFYNLVKIGFFHDVSLFRVVKGFVVQWGIHGNPEVSKHWSDANLAPDPVKKSNTKGMVTYAMAGSPDTRSTQLFINYGNNARLDGMGFAPICQVSKGMEVAEKLEGSYGEEVTSKQGQIQTKGNAYLKEAYPKLDYILKTSIIKEGPKAPADAAGDKKDSPSSGLPTTEKSTDTSTYVIVGLLAAGALLAFMFLRRSDDEPEPAPEPSARKEKARTASTPKRTASAGAASAGTAASTKKKKKKKARKAT